MWIRYTVFGKTWTAPEAAGDVTPVDTSPPEMTTNEPTRQNSKKRTEDSNDARTVDIVSVSTPMDSVLRSGCEASVDWWTDGEHAFVDVDLEIGAP